MIYAQFSCFFLCVEGLSWECAFLTFNLTHGRRVTELSGEPERRRARGPTP